MWRGARAGWIVHDQVLPGQYAALWLYVWLGLIVVLVLEAPWFTPIGLVAVLLRNRIAVHRPSGRVRVAWVFAPTPHSPGVPLRTVVDADVSALSEVWVAPRPQRRRPGILEYWAIELAYRAPAYRGGEYRESVTVAMCVGHPRTLAIAGRLAADLGLPVRDLKTSPPVELGM